MPRRPAFGTSGRKVVLWANYFKLDVKGPPLHKYEIITARVDISPEDMERMKQRSRDDDPAEVKGKELQEVIALAIKKLNPPPDTVATEFRSQLVSVHPLKLPTDGVVKINYSPSPGKDRQYEVSFHGPASVRIGDLLEWLVAFSSNTNHDQQFPKFTKEIMAIQIIMGHASRAIADVKVLSSGRVFPLNMPHLVADAGNSGMKVIARGLIHSVRPATGGLLLNANVTHGIFRKPGNLRTIIQSLGLAQMNNSNANFRAYFSQLVSSLYTNSGTETKLT
jgi:eukaryotic translation initiation factor 2C